MVMHSFVPWENKTRSGLVCQAKMTLSGVAGFRGDQGSAQGSGHVGFRRDQDVKSAHLFQGVHKPYILGSASDQGIVFLYLKPHGQGVQSVAQP